jgi:hypothetical protein
MEWTVVRADHAALVRIESLGLLAQERQTLVVHPLGKPLAPRVCRRAAVLAVSSHTSFAVQAAGPSPDRSPATRAGKKFSE